MDHVHGFKTLSKTSHRYTKTFYEF